MIVEFEFDVAPFRRALDAAPDVEVEMEHLAATDTVPLRTFFWARGGDLDTFEDGLDEDPGVRDPELVTETEDSRLYRVNHPDDLPAVDAYRAAVELDAVVRSVTGTSDGIEVEMRFPDRDTLSEWREKIRDRGLSMEIRAIYEQDEVPPERHHGLSEQQREALVVAGEQGYFSIPRETSLAGLAEELGVSSQAASERLRRGMDKLVDETLVEDESGE